MVISTKTRVILSEAGVPGKRSWLAGVGAKNLLFPRSTTKARSQADDRTSRRVPGTGISRSEAGTGISRREAGVTLVELIITVAILSILASAAVPITRFEHKREKERELRYDLWTLRAAIDKYKDAADRQAFQTKVDSYNYPPDLATLVKGVDVQGKKVKFLRRIPIDPMTGKDEWGMRSMQDDADATSFGGQNLFDIYSKSDGTALDGTKYSTW